jgi:hypothetical protein
MDAEVSTHTFLTMIIEESVCFMSCEPIFVFAIILMWYTRNIFLFFLINWTLRMSNNLPERVQILGHAHILCITVRDNIIICCQIFCDFLLKSAFERIFNVMQLILVKIKWHIKWQYLIQKFHDICLSYYFNCMPTVPGGQTQILKQTLKCTSGVRYPQEPKYSQSVFKHIMETG